MFSNQEKIKLKHKVDNTKVLTQNLRDLNFHFQNAKENEHNIKITFFSQYQIERFLNITNLKNYKIKTFIENFSPENLNKIGFYFIFSKQHLEFVNESLNNYINRSKQKLS